MEELKAEEESKDANTATISQNDVPITQESTDESDRKELDEIRDEHSERAATDGEE